MIGLSFLARYATAAAVVAAFVAGAFVSDLISSRKIAKLEIQIVSMERAQATALVRAAERAMAVEAALADKFKGETDAARKETVAQSRRSADARRVADRLREHVVVLAGRCAARTEDPGSADGGASAPGTGLVLAELYGSAQGRAVELAEAYDSSRRAGALCERLYDASRAAVNKEP